MAGVVVLAVVAVVVLSLRVPERAPALDAGDLAAARDGQLDHSIVTEVLRRPAPDGTHYPAGSTGLMISEVVATNGTTLADEDGEHSDWIELHNPTDQPIDVAGFHLSDDDRQPHRWRLPSRVIEPGGRLIVFASGKDRAPELEDPAVSDPVGAPGEQLHANFRLGQDGEPISLVEPDGLTIADRLPPMPLHRDTSIGRHANDQDRTCLFAEPQPGERNHDVCYEDLRIGAPELSAGSGFHEADLEVTVTALAAVAAPADADEDEAPTDVRVGGRLLYTLDGSYPDLERNAEATLVHDPVTDGQLRLTFDDRSDEEPVLAPIWTGLDQRFPQRGPVQVPLQAEVLRVRAEHGLESGATYLVGEGFEDLELPVVSLTLDPDHFYDPDTGIYVPGTQYERWAASDDYDPDHGFRIPANPVERGRAWERPFEHDPRRAVRFTYCEQPGAETCTLEQDVGVRIHGNFSRLLPQKNLRLYARNHYGPRTFDHPFFGERGPEQHRRLILRGSGNDWGMTMLWDAYLQTLMHDLRFDTQAYQPTVVFINGEYWGLHNLRERYDRHYLEQTHGVDPDQVAIIARDGIVETGVAADGEDYLELIAAVEAAPPGDEETIERIEREVDVEGLFDTVIARTFVSDTDWPHSNQLLWRVRTTPTGGAHHPEDGRWRWMSYDLDHAGGGMYGWGQGHATAIEKDAELDALGRFLDADQHPEWAQDLRILLEALLAVDDHREAFVERYEHHLDVTFDPDRTLEVLEQQAGAIEAEMVRHTARWGYPRDVEQWRSYIEEVRLFMQRRPSTARAQLHEHLG